MNISDLVRRLMAGESLTPAEVSALLRESVASLAVAADQSGESTDYVIEAMLERVTSMPAEFVALRQCIESEWLGIDSVPGGSIYEVVVRAAESLAAINRLAPLQFEVIQAQASDPDWRTRLVAAWTLRDEKTGANQAVRDQLARDSFQDDNGVFLVREGVGVYED